MRFPDATGWFKDSYRERMCYKIIWLRNRWRGHNVMEKSVAISHCSTCLCDGLRHHDHPNADSNGLLRAYPCDGTPNRACLTHEWWVPAEVAEGHFQGYSQLINSSSHREWSYIRRTIFMWHYFGTATLSGGMMTIPSPTEINSRSIVKSELSELKVRHKLSNDEHKKLEDTFWESKFTWNKLQMLLGHISFSARVPLPCCYDGWSELLQEQLETRRSYNKSCVCVCIYETICTYTYA